MFEFGFGEEFEEDFEEEPEMTVEEAVELFRSMTAPKFRSLTYSLKDIEQKIPMMERLKNMDVWTLLQEKPELTAEKAREIIEAEPFYMDYAEEQEKEKTGKEALFQTWSAVRLEL